MTDSELSVVLHVFFFFCKEVLFVLGSLLCATNVYFCRGICCPFVYVDRVDWECVTGISLGYFQDIRKRNSQVYVKFRSGVEEP